MEEQKSWPAAVFNDLYASNIDPWQFGGDYEQEKYDATIALLGERRFQSALEIGCSTGVLTRRLAPRCRSLLAIDFAPAALAKARANCADLPHVRFQEAAIPRGFPWGLFDLIVLSEVLYFLDPVDLRATAGHVAISMAPNAAVPMVNYLGPTDSPCGGDEAANLFIAALDPDVIPVLQRRTPFYRLDLLGPPPQSD